MPLIGRETRYQEGVPTRVEDPTPEPKPLLGETFGAAFRQGNIVPSLYERVTERRTREQEGYDPLDDISGYEEYSRRFIEADSPEETQQIKSRIDRERSDQKILADAGGLGLAASFAAGAIDPATLASLAVPVASGATTAARVGKAIATSVAIDTASEIAFQQIQETRTLGQSAINIGASAVLSGLLGGIAGRVPQREFKATRDAINAELNASGSTVGAASARTTATLEEEGIAGIGERIAKTIGRITPLSRLLTSPSKAGRQIAQDLIEVPFVLSKNEMGAATATAVETLVKRYDATVAKFATDFDAAFQAYRKRALEAGEKPMRAAEFRQQIAYAMRRNDTSAIPEAAALAKSARSSIIDPLTKQLQSVGLLKDPVAEDVARLTNEAVGKYVRAQGKQLYADYSARTLATARKELGTQLRTAASKVRDETREALAKLAEPLQAAETAYKLAKRKIRKEFEGASTRGAMRSKRAAIRKARTELERARKTERRARLAERKRGREAIAKLRSKAAAELEQRKPVPRKQFAKLARKGAQGDPAITEFADLLRKRDAGQLKDKVQVPQSKVTGLKTVGAQSYLPRLYDVPKIKKNLGAFQDGLKRWFAKQGVAEEELEALVQDVTRTITGSMRGYTDLAPNVVVKAGPLKERTLNVPDEILEPFLVNDAELVLSQYVRSVAPQLEITRRFGDLDLKQAIQNLKDEYGQLLAKATTDKERKALEQRLADDFQDIVGVRDRLLGKLGIPADPDSVVVRSARLMRSYNYVRLLGSQVLSSMADVGRIVTQYGLVRTGRAMAVLATNFKAAKLSAADAKRMGIGLDWTLNTRGATLGDIGGFADTTAEQVAQKASNLFSRATGMATWNSAMKFLASSLQQDQILRAIVRGELSDRMTTKLAQLGLEKSTLKRIGQQVAKHGDDSEGLARARTELWDDKEAALLYESAILKAADTVVMTKGAGDTPLMLSNEAWKTILQFKGFGIAAVNRLVIPAAQGIQRGDLAMMNGLAVMLGLGVFRYVAKQWTSDQPIETEPGRLMAEAIDGSGLATYLVDGYDVFAGMTGLPRASRYTDRSWLETAAGPSAGTISDLGRTVEDLRKDGVSEKDIHKLRKLFPGQNIVYLRRIINLLEGETADALGVPAG